MSRLLRAVELYKSYAGRGVVAGVSLAVESGQVIGLLGPNGAGKTTCFYMVVGLARPDRGQVHQPTERGPEAASVDVEGSEVLVEADVEEIAAGGDRTVAGRLHDGRTDSPVAMVGVDHHVFDECVDRAVPQDVGEADESIIVPGDDPAEAVSAGLLHPVPLGLVEQARLEGGCVECVDLAVGERPTPGADDVAGRRSRPTHAGVIR